jgi:hypothetical protein
MSEHLKELSVPCLVYRALVQVRAFPIAKTDSAARKRKKYVTTYLEEAGRRLGK